MEPPKFDGEAVHVFSTGERRRLVEIAPLVFEWQPMNWEIQQGDCRELMAALGPETVDAIVTDPPYGLEFMGKEWDSPWKRGEGVNKDAGFSPVEMLDGYRRVPRPSNTGSTNPSCLNCGGTRRGRRDGTALRRVCVCDDPKFPNVRAMEMRAFQEWCEAWAIQALRVLKPGGYFVAFGGTRTSHRLTCALEDAGFEIRDCLMWLYGSGFPKSLDVSKAIDKAAGAPRQVIGPRQRVDGKKPGHSALGANATFGESEDLAALVETGAATDAAREWAGWGTALKPAWEPIILARKPLNGTVAANVQAHGTGALDVDGCRIGTETTRVERVVSSGPLKWEGGSGDGRKVTGSKSGRWPANLVLDEDAAGLLDEQSGTRADRPSGPRTFRKYASGAGADGNTSAALGRESRCVGEEAGIDRGDGGGASRFFYTAKASASERHYAGKNTHPTVKPVALMRWLCRLVTPPGGLVLDPFMGSGSTGIAALAEGFRFLGMEQDAESVAMARRRIAGPLFADTPA